MDKIIEKIINQEAVIDCTIQVGGLAAKHRFTRYQSYIANNYLYIKGREHSIDIPIKKFEEAVCETRAGLTIGRLDLLAERSLSITFCINQNGASSMSGRTRMRHQLSTNI